MNDYVEFEALKGKTLTKVTVNDDKDEIVFECADGSSYRMYHSQDCCESVSIEDICGELQNLIGHEILEAYESTSTKDPAPHDNPESYTWTYYRIRTMYDTVVIRWYGESNGYYSESVDFVRLKNANLDDLIPKATTSYFEGRDVIKAFLDAVDKRDKLKQDVIDWMTDQGKQGILRYNSDAPMWTAYVQSEDMRIHAEKDAIPALREFVK